MKKTILLIGFLLLSISSLGFAQSSLTLEQRLTRLEDIEAIRTLLHSYGRYVDERNWQAFSELYSENNGTWNGGMGIAEGRQAIINMMESSMGDENIGTNGEGISNLHLISNEFIEVNGATGTALSKWVFVMTAEEGGPELVYVGHYDDQLIKEHGAWKFKYRTVSGDIMGSMNLPAVGD